MIIDAHTHIFPPEISTEKDKFLRKDSWFAELYTNPKARLASAEDLITSMDRNGIDTSVICGFAWKDAGLIRLTNDYLADAVQKYPSRCIAFATVNPIAKDCTQEIERCAELGFRGIGELMPAGQRYALSDSAALRPLAETARERNLIILTHTSEPVGHVYAGKEQVFPQELAAFLAAFPENKVIAAHWGGGLPFYHLMPEIRALAKNCWYDCAAAAYLYDPAVFSAALYSGVLPEHIVWGSDYAIISQKKMLAYIRSANIETTVLEAALGLNMQRLLDSMQEISR